MALKIENVFLEENLPTIAAKSETDERFPREDTPPTKAESFIREATLRTRGRAGRSAEDRLLCKQEALGSNPSRSIASFSTKDLSSDRLTDAEISAMGEETNGTANNSTAAWRAILEDPDVREWHATMELKKTGTADERGRVLFRYCKALKTTPAAIVAGARDLNGGRRGVERKLQNFVVMLHGHHKP